MNIGIQINKDLIGNLIILLADRCKSLYHTKMMKLLFLIDEEATREKGTPITWLDYKAWKLGPVSPELFYSKNPGYNKFDKFVVFEKLGFGNSYLVKPIRPFDDSEFSEWDLEIVDKVLEKYGHFSTQGLINQTHLSNSLWDKTVKEYGLKFTGANMTSDKSIDFLNLIQHDDILKSVYYSALENNEIKSSLQ